MAEIKLLDGSLVKVEENVDDLRSKVIPATASRWSVQTASIVEPTDVGGLSDSARETR